MVERSGSSCSRRTSWLVLCILLLTGMGLFSGANSSHAQKQDTSNSKAASEPPAPGATAGSTTDYGRTGYLSVTGPIDRLRKRYLSRVIEEARAEKLDTLVVHIDTDGGTVFDARDMFKQVLDQDRDGPRMVALVDYRAISAGAMA